MLNGGHIYKKWLGVTAMSILATVLKMVGQHGRSQTSVKWIYYKCMKLSLLEEVITR